MCFIIKEGSCVKNVKTLPIIIIILYNYYEIINIDGLLDTCINIPITNGDVKKS